MRIVIDDERPMKRRPIKPFRPIRRGGVRGIQPIDPYGQPLRVRLEDRRPRIQPIQPVIPGQRAGAFQARRPIPPGDYGQPLVRGLEGRQPEIPLPPTQPVVAGQVPGAPITAPPITPPVEPPTPVPEEQPLTEQQQAELGVPTPTPPAPPLPTTPPEPHAPVPEYQPIPEVYTVPIVQTMASFIQDEQALSTTNAFGALTYTEQMLQNLADMENWLRAQYSPDKIDTYTMALLKDLRRQGEEERRKLLTFLNQRGVLQSGIMLEEMNRWYANQLSSEERILSQRMAQNNELLMQGLLNLSQMRIDMLKHAETMEFQKIEAEREQLRFREEMDWKKEVDKYQRGLDARNYALEREKWLAQLEELGRQYGLEREKLDMMKHQFDQEMKYKYYATQISARTGEKYKEYDAGVTVTLLEHLKNAGDLETALMQLSTTYMKQHPEADFSYIYRELTKWFKQKEKTIADLQQYRELMKRESALITPQAPVIKPLPKPAPKIPQKPAEKIIRGRARLPAKAPQIPKPPKRTR